jgi:oxepin-CoA hydrolase/3-oxo-5,6-dehydrosuberyl-CoA semialdehyde dehydrogenase
MQLESYLAGSWVSGSDAGTPLHDPVTGAELARASGTGLDLAGALAYAREYGGPALRALSYGERGSLLRAVADVLAAHRDAYRQIALENSGNTAGDAALDIDGGIGTLKYYAALGQGLGAARWLVEPGSERLARDAAFQAVHLLTPLAGVAVHINAFNFPAWGQAEKMACALLAGMPVLEKPGTPTAMVAERIGRIIVESGALPEGAYSILVGEAGDLLDHLLPQDVVAFTGSSGTAATLRAHAAFVQRGARLNVEADSLNAAVLGADVQPESDTFDLFVKDAVREITQKCGQKCTATRRIIAPAAIAPALAEALAAGLQAVRVGDPADDSHRMGPLTNRAQLQSVQTGITRLLSAAQAATGGPERLGEVGCFVAPTLLVGQDAHADVFHDEEVFGPVASILPTSGAADEAAALVARGGGGLVASVYSDDRELPGALALALAPWSGRVYLAGKRVAEHGTGPGLVLPTLVHGGPGRAGGGEELGGLRGLSLYMQRTAVQGFRSILESALGAGAGGADGD